MKINTGTGNYEWEYLNKEVWHKIEEELGEVTDFQIEKGPSEHLPIVIAYKANGIAKVAYLGGFKILVQSLIYSIKEFEVKK